MKLFNRKSRKLNSNQSFAALVLNAPAILLMFLMMFLPLIMSVGYSLTDKMLVSNAKNGLNFVGLKNYFKLFTSEAFRNACFNTIFYTVMIVPAILILAVLLAVLINRKVKGITFFRTIYFSPQVVTMTVVAVVWALIYSPGENGLLNSFLGLFGIKAQLWLKSPDMAMPSIVIMSVWQALGMQAIIVLGGLQYIPAEIYEAAKVDGCNSFQEFLYVTLPLLKNTLTYVIVTNTISSLRLFNQVYVLTNGGPMNSTESIVFQMYKTGFNNNQVGYSSAMAVVFCGAVLIISVLQNKYLGGED
ncbi:MAG: carbohydrate ABC transporter permease [Muricoprocola sp.]